MPKDLNDFQIQELVHKWLHDALSEEYERRIDRKVPWNREKLQEILDQHEDFYGQAVDALEDCDYRSVRKLADGLIKEAKLEVEQGSTSYNKLCATLLHAQTTFHRKAKEHPMRPPEPLLAPSYPIPQPAPETVAEVKTTPTLTEAVEKYITIKVSNGEWKESSIKDMAPQLRQFAEWAGADVPMHELNNDHMRTYQQRTNRLPSGRFMSYYKGMSIEKLMKTDIPEQHRLKPKSIKTRLDNVRSFLNWAEVEDYIGSAKKLNAALAMKKLEAKSKHSIRRAFKADELKAIFHSPQYHGTTNKKQEFTKAWQFWTPLIALFTGARIEEICQLHLSDIREAKGVPYFDINAEGDKDVKTEAGKRQVPIHPFLIELGFLDRVKARRAKGEEHLFSRDTLSEKATNVSANVTKWFTRYRRDCGVGAGAAEVSDVTFHSFRHTFITWAKLHDIDRMKLKEVVGHEAGELDDITTIYEGRYPVSTLMKDVIEPVDFHKELELDFLKNHEWTRNYK